MLPRVLEDGEALAADVLLRGFSKIEALRIERTASLLARARGWLRDEHVLAPADSALRRAVGAARHKARALLTQRLAERLSAPMRDRLDALVAVGDDHPHSPLHQIKASSSNPSVGGMKRLLARLESIEATGVLEIDVGWVKGNYQRILFHSVRTASADRVREMAAPRRYLALVCFLHQAWRDTLDQAVDMYGKLLDRNRKLVEDRLDDMLKAQRHAVDRIVHRYRRLGAVLLDPDIGDDELRARLLSTVPEGQLREDQSDLANWTRGDRKARFEQTAERHAGLSQFAAPFLSRMKFVDEQSEGVSPTLSALRVYREHRAAGRRGLPPDAPLDFAPAALQPLIRHNGVTDRRRWESALFLKVRDEIQTGNLAIDGAKNFGRFEAFFLPGAQWEQVREAFWARTGFSVDPDAAVEQLKARLSDAVDRFLAGVADNRQVVFDDDGWRLKTDAAEHPDPAQSDRLAELHRWLDARSRSIRLADLLIEVENDLGFSVHFQRPDEQRVDPGEVCALLATILAHGCNLGLYTMEKVAPDIAYRRLKYVSDWRLVEENQRAALAAIVHGISRLDAAAHWGDGTTSASDGQRFAMPHKVLQRHLQHPLQRLRARVLLLRRRQLRPVLQPPDRVHRPRRPLRARRRALPRERPRPLTVPRSARPSTARAFADALHGVRRPCGGTSHPLLFGSSPTDVSSLCEVENRPARRLSADPQAVSPLVRRAEEGEETSDAIRQAHPRHTGRPVRPRTRAAIREWQQSRGASPTGYPERRGGGASANGRRTAGRGSGSSPAAQGGCRRRPHRLVG